MKAAFEAVWEHGQLVPVEASIRIHEHSRLLVVILDEQKAESLPSLAGEARRQSLLVSQYEHSEDDIWEANIDDNEWRG
jgi:hypothetical protein